MSQDDLDRAVATLLRVHPEKTLECLDRIARVLVERGVQGAISFGQASWWAERLDRPGFLQLVRDRLAAEARRDSQAAVSYARELLAQPGLASVVDLIVSERVLEQLALLAQAEHQQQAELRAAEARRGRCGAFMSGANGPRCMRPIGHPGAHGPRCDSWSARSGVRCEREDRHPGDHAAGVEGWS